MKAFTLGILIKVWQTLDLNGATKTSWAVLLFVIVLKVCRVEL